MGLKKWSKLLTGLAILIPFLSSAQSTTETALLFSRVKPGGSARIQGMGGVQTSLGGDYSSAFSNPAGLGMFNKSEASITLGYLNANNTSDYLGNKQSENVSGISIPGFGMVFQTDKDGRSGFLSGAFGVSYNRLNSFNQKFSYSGRNDKNSIIDYFIQDANGVFPDDLKPGGSYFNSPTGLAYNNYLIEDSTFLNPDASPLDYLSVLGVYPNNPSDIREVTQSETVTFEGTQNQWSFSYGANLSDKFFLGAGVGLATLRFTSTKTYRESDYFFVLDPTFKPMDNMVLEEQLRITGSGINANLGFIFRPIDMVQVGLSYITPTKYLLTDSYTAAMDTKWNNFDYFGDGKPINNVSEQTDELITDYDLKTPGRLNLGATAFFEKSGFISADVEFVNYGGAKYSSTTSGVSFDSDNERIKELYSNVVNYRIGGEYRLKTMRFRAGYSFMSEPFKSQQNGVSRNISSITGGLGYRTQKFFIDFALIYTQSDNSYRPYRVNSVDSPLVLLNNKTTQGIVTIGFPF